MKKLIVLCAVALTALLVLALAVGCGNTVPQGKSPQFEKITAPLSLNEEEENATLIPYGSVIYHWANGITEVYGLDNTRIFIAKDSEAAQISAPGGSKPATHIYHIPNEARVSEEDSNITKVYLGESLILTVIKKSESFSH
jgi:hypothetical protein